MRPGPDQRPTTCSDLTPSGLVNKLGKAFRLQPGDRPCNFPELASMRMPVEFPGQLRNKLFHSLIYRKGGLGPMANTAEFQTVVRIGELDRTVDFHLMTLDNMRELGVR